MSSSDIDKLKEYLESSSSENSQDHLIYPLLDKLFDNSWKRGSEAQGADAYVSGRLIVEFKTKTEDWLAGLFQAAHYGKKGLSFNSLCVITHKFIGVWNKSNLPYFFNKLSDSADPIESPSSVGVKLAKRINKGQEKEILSTSKYQLSENDFGSIFPVEEKLAEFKDVLKNIDSRRIQVNPNNFIQKIDSIKKFFSNPMEAIHCFYTIVNYWDETAVVPQAQPSKPLELSVICRNGKYQSDMFTIATAYHEPFRKLIENNYVFTNLEAGIDIDYYFSRFDEVISKLDPDYTKQHGIFFTDINLSKFALWFIHHYFEKRLSEKYIVFDPAAGSGNLVTSWRRNHLKHKIVSELQPDLLRIIERRMEMDEMHQKTGFTIVPKTIDNKGLNFLDKSASNYLSEIRKVLEAKGTKIDKPFAFLLNPPYKNTDENESVRIEKSADYNIDPEIVKITGDDAGKERYASFLAQILNICKHQVDESPSFKPIILIFTPTSWLVPRPTYIKFREVFDQYFKYENGFLFTGNEFFKIGGRFPITFTIWSWNLKKHGNKNIVVLKDFSNLTAEKLNINWNQDKIKIDRIIGEAIRGFKRISLSATRQSIKAWCGQSMYDFKRDKTKEEKNLRIVGGLPLKDPRRENKKTYGVLLSNYIGFMDDSTPVRIKPKNDGRFLSSLDCVWFRLDNDFKSLNKTRIINGPTDKYGYAAYDLNSAQKTFSWFALTKSLNGQYPLWANQLDIWRPSIKAKFSKRFFSLCFAFGLAENRCIVSKFEKNNPTQNNPEVFIQNPLCPIDSKSFWSRILSHHIIGSESNSLVKIIEELYRLWAKKYCNNATIDNIGLNNEPYFKFFSYPDFLMPFSGLVQIRRYTELHSCPDLSTLFNRIDDSKKLVKEKIYEFLVKDMKYFG